MHAPQTEPSRELDVVITPPDLPGVLGLPANARGIVVFAHGSGSSRLSPRNTAVARTLQGTGMATLLFDLLTRREAADRENVFDIPLLASRLETAIRFVRSRPETSGLPVGLFGASTGAAAALTAAALWPEGIHAVVSRGGRPDLSGEALSRVRAPTLLIVGENDTEVLALNRAAQGRLAWESSLAVVAGATHLFEEPGAMEEVALLAAHWFSRHVRKAPHE